MVGFVLGYWKFSEFLTELVNRDIYLLKTSQKND